MERFARLFDTPKGQVLITVEEDEVNDYELNIRIQRDGVTMTNKLGFEHHSEVLEALENFDESKVISFYDQLESFTQ